LIVDYTNKIARHMDKELFIFQEFLQVIKSTPPGGQPFAAIRNKILTLFESTPKLLEEFEQLFVQFELREGLIYRPLQRSG
jgi:histone deacetylase complex regulatory component SIN3